MEDNRKFATFFADAPKGKKIGAVLSWICICQVKVDTKKRS